MQELTERQSTIIRLIAEGHTVKEIATTLPLKVVTVRKHIKRIAYKLNAKTTCHAAAIYARQATPAGPTVGSFIDARNTHDRAAVGSFIDAESDHPGAPAPTVTNETPAAPAG